MSYLHVAALGLVAACASDPGTSTEGRVTLSGVVGMSDGFDLATSTVVATESAPLGEPSRCEAAGCDFYLSIAMATYLFGPHLFDGEVEHAFCHRGLFARVDDIPIDVAGCDWGPAGVGVGEAINHGFLVRDRRHERQYRLLVVDDNVSIFDGSGSVTFEVAPAGLATR